MISVGNINTTAMYQHGPRYCREHELTLKEVCTNGSESLAIVKIAN
jgi:hypothetical protein